MSILAWFCFIFYCLTVVSSSNLEEYNKAAHKLSNFLSSTFLNVTRFDIIDKSFVGRMSQNLEVQQISPDVVIDKVQKDITDYLNMAVQSLKNIVQVAEDTAKEVEYHFAPSQFEVENYTYNDLREFQMNPMENDSPLVTSGVHVPLDVFIGDQSVIRDIEWTNNDNILTQFMQNAQGKAPLLRQYIATHAGITRIYPAYHWKLEPSLMTVDLFDPRYRHWFTSAITCPKDVLFLLDYSGSVTGQTLRLIKLTVMTILASLTADDYINAISFNKEAKSVMKECFDGFVPATTRNKLLLQKKLEQEPNYEANFTLGLKYAYSAFSNLTNYTEILHDLNYGSGCHKMIIVMTDSTEDHTEQIFDKLQLRNEDGTLNVSVRFFGIAMGFGTSDIKLMQEMSCMDKGFYTKIDSVEDIKLQSRMFFPVLSRPLALTYANMSVLSRPVTWTGPYMDAQGAGPVLTLSMPIVNTMLNGSDQEFVGVAAIDVRLSELQAFTQTNDLGPDAYFFITDGNGHLIYHPRRRVPETDLQMIRRSACFDASANKSGDATVLFTDATEETYAKMGYYETLPHLDMLEIEFPTDQTEKFRQIMVSQTCSVESDIVESNSITLLSENFSERRYILYKCRQIANTSFSIALASPNAHPSGARIKPEVDVSGVSLIEHPLVWWASSPRVHCGIDFGAINVFKRAILFNETWHTNCVRMNDFTKRLLLDFDALSPWVANLPEIPINSSCDEMFSTEIFQIVFIQTDGGLTVTYPRCNKYFPDFLILDTWNSDQYEVAKQSPNSLTVTSSATPGFVNLMKMVSWNNFPLAVVGAILPLNYVSEYFRNLTELSECFSKEGPTVKWCHLVTRDLTVIYSNGVKCNASHKGYRLGTVDCKLFEHMVNQSYVSSIVYKDYQAKCGPDEEQAAGGPVSDAHSLAPSLSRWVTQLIGSFAWFLDRTLWLQLWSFVFTLLTPTKARLPNCQLVSPKKEHNCILERHFYTFDLTKLPLEGEFDEGTCIRKFNLVPVPNTNLFVAIIDKRCKEGSFTFLPVRPVQLSECKEIKSKYRNRKTEHCTPFHPLENTTKCSQANKLTSLNFLAVLFLFYISFGFYPRFE